MSYVMDIKYKKYFLKEKQIHGTLSCTKFHFSEKLTENSGKRYYLIEIA